MVLRVGELTYGDSHFGLWLRVYGPDGALVGRETEASTVMRVRNSR